MIIMIILLFLSATTALITAYYLNNKKKDINKNIKQKENTNGTSKDKHSKKKLTDILDLKIKDNMICLGNRYSYVIRLGSIDYHILSNSEQESIETILNETSRSIDYPIEFFSTTEYINTSKIIGLIKENKVSSTAIQEYQNKLINYLQALMENRSVSVIKNYAIISYDGLYENAEEELSRYAGTFISSMGKAKIRCELLTEEEIYDLIYRELNKNSALSIYPLKEGGKNLYVGEKRKIKRNRHIQKST